MKTTIVVKKISLEAVLGILLEMRDENIEYVNFECEMTPTRDNVHIVEYRSVKNPYQQTLDIDSAAKEEERLNYIKKIIDEHGSN